MATLKTVRGTSLSKRFHALQRQTEWVARLKNNSRKLTRLANLVCLAQGFEKPGKDGNKLRLQYIGKATNAVEAQQDLARIQKVLCCVLAPELGYTCLVRLGRMTVEITLATPWVARKAA